jgi:hypothetical protein
MPNWKKVVVSGSDALLNSVTASFTGSLTGALIGTASWAVSASQALTASYSRNLQISGSINNVNYIDFNTGSTIGTNEPAWKEGRVFYDSGSGALAVYNWEQDITLNVGQESWLRARNQTGTLITNGTVVRLLGAIGDRPTITPAQATDQTNTFSTDNEIIGMATHDIETGTDGFVTTFGIVNGVNTAAFTAGDLIWVSQSAGQFTNVAPPPPIDKTFVGIVTRANVSNGSIFITPNSPIHFHDISTVSASVYQMGDLWMYRSGSVGQANAWINTKALTGSYGISGSLNVNGSITGSLFGTASWAQSASNAITAIDATSAEAAKTVRTISSSVNAVFYPTFVDSNNTPASNEALFTSDRITFNPGGQVLTVRGLSAQNIQVTSSLTVTGSATFAGGITGSLLGTASFATSASQAVSSSYALTASFALNSGGGAAFPFTGSALITGSLGVTGSTSIRGTFNQGSASLASGLFSHVQGFITTASGDYSHAEGYSAKAIGTASHAEGYFTQANSTYSHAEGNNTTAFGFSSHTEGYITQTVGNSSHAEGTGTQAIGDYSHAEGDSVKTGTTNAYSTSVSSGVMQLDSGYGDVSAQFVTGNRLFLYDAPFVNVYGRATFIVSQSYYTVPNTYVELVDTSVTTATAYVGSLDAGIANWTGNSTIPGDYSHAEGGSTYTIGNVSHAEGYLTTAIGGASHAEGESTQAIGDASHAEGSTTIAIGAYSHAEGNGTQAIGDNSHAEGGATQALGDTSHAEGRSTVTSGSYSHAEGNGTITIGDYSHAEGFGTVALGSYQHVQGQYNISSSAQSAFIIGNGTSTSARSNLVFASGSQFQITGSLIVSGSGTFTNIGPAVFSGSLVASGSSHDLRAVNNVSIQTPRTRIYDPTATIGSSDNLYLNTTSATGGLYWSSNDEVIANFNQTIGRFNYGNSSLYVLSSDNKTYSPSGFVGPLQGTASFATTASFALAVAGGGGGGGDTTAIEAQFYFLM